MTILQKIDPAALASAGDSAAFEWVLAGLESKHTARAYKRALSDFLTWYTGQGAPGLSRAIVSAYKADLLAKGKSAAVINQALSAIRLMAREAADNGKLDRQTAAAIVSIKGVKGSTIPAGRSISPGEMSALIGSGNASIADVRDAAMLALLYAGGLRRGELAALDLADYDAGLGELKVLHAKGNKQRITPVLNGAAAALAAIAQMSDSDNSGFA